MLAASDFKIKNIKRTFIIIILILIVGTSMESCSKGGSGDPEPPSAIAPNPSAAQLILPANNKTCETGIEATTTQRIVAFSWAAADNTETYDLTITNLSTNEVINNKGLLTITKEVTLIKGTPYQWKVTSNSSKTSTTTGSELWKFYLAGDGIVNYAPFPADLIIPVSESIVKPTSENMITLSWEGSDADTANDSLTYTVYVDTVDGKQTPIDELTNISNSTVEISVVPNSDYYWRIKTSDGDNSSFTVVHRFQIE